MRLNNGKSAVAVPLALVIITSVFFVARVYLESVAPKKETSPINWITLEKLRNSNPKPDDMIFYEFVDNSESSQTMDRGTFRTKDVVSRLNSEFITVRIDDIAAQTNPALKEPVQELERKYSISAFPAYVVVLGDQTWVSSKIGSCTARSMLKFLNNSKEKSGYCRALTAFATDPAASAQSLEKWIKMRNWINEDAMLATAYCATGYILNKDQKSADEILSYTDTKLSSHFYDNWPRPLLQYLRHEIPQDKLFSDVDFDSDALTTAKFIVAMNLKAQGNIPGSRRLLKWIQQNGSRESEAYLIGTTMLANAVKSATP